MKFPISQTLLLAVLSETSAKRNLRIGARKAQALTADAAIDILKAADLSLDLDGQLNLYEFTLALIQNGVSGMTTQQVSDLFNEITNGGYAIVLSDLGIGGDGLLDNIDTTVDELVENVDTIVEDTVDNLDTTLENLEETVDTTLDNVDTTLDNLLSNVDATFQDFIADLDLSLFDADGDGIINLSESTLGLDSNGVTAVVAADSQITALEDLINLSADGTVSVADLEASLNIDGASTEATFDANTGGAINVQEFVFALDDAQIVSLTVDEANTLLAQLQGSVDNSVGLADLQTALTDLENLISRISAEFQTFINNLDIAALDVNGDGSLNLLESTVGLDINGVNGFVATDAQITALKDLVTADVDGTISIEDIIASLNIEGDTPYADVTFNAETGGSINIEEFVFVLESGGLLEISTEEINALVTDLDATEDNVLNLQDLESTLNSILDNISDSFQTFLDNLDLAAVLDVDGDGSTNLLEASVGLDGAGVSAFVATDAQITALQEILASASVDGTVSLEQIQAAIAIDGETYADITFDADTGGAINIEEFLFGLTSGGIADISVAELDILVADLDATVDNMLNLQDLETSLNTMLDAVSDAFQTFLSNLDLAALDVNADGSLDLLEATVGLDEAGISAFISTDAQVAALQDLLNTNVDASISLADLQAAVAIDGAAYADVTFDAENGGTVNIEELLFGLESSGILEISSVQLEALVADLDATIDNLLNLQDLETTLNSLLKPIYTGTGLGDIRVALDAVDTTLLDDIANLDLDLKLFDSDGDGFLTTVELETGLSSSNIVASSDAIVDLYVALDVDGDGKVAFAEVELPKVLEAVASINVGDFDLDLDGDLNIFEFYNALVQGGVTDLTIAEIELIFDYFDGDGDLSVSVNDLQVAVELPSFVNFERCGTINLYELGRRIAELDVDLDLSTTAGIDALAVILEDVSVEVDGLIENVEETLDQVITDVDNTVDNLIENVVEPVVDELVDAVDTTLDNTIDAVDETIDNVVDVVNEVVDVEPVVDELVDAVDTTLDNTIDAVDETIDNIVDVVTDGDITVDEVVDVVDTTVDTVVEDVVQPAVDEVVDVVDAVDEVVDTPLDEVVADVDTTVDTVIEDVVQPTVDGLLDTDGCPIDLSSPLLNQDLIASISGVDISVFDQDGNGAIGAYEFTVGLIQSGISASQLDLSALFAALDLDGDLSVLTEDFLCAFN